MTTLPLLLLPDLVFRQIYDFFEVPVIILLSQLSKRINHLVKSQETPKRGRMLDVILYTHSAVVTLITFGKNSGRNFREFTWTLGFKKRKFVKRVIEGRTWKVAQDNFGSTKGWKSNPAPGFLEADLLSLVRFFRSLFKCPIISVILGIESIEAIDELIMRANDLHEARRIYVRASILDKNRMDFMLDHFVTEALHISGCPGDDYKYQGTLNFKKIKLSGARWIDLEMLEKMSLTCKRIVFENASLLTNADFNQFIKNWMAGENRSLETVKFKWRRSLAFTPIRLPVVMNEIPHSLGAKKRPNAAEYFETCYMYENGVDIRRSSDGLLATALVVQDKFEEEFVFTVWYDKEPNLVEGV